MTALFFLLVLFFIMLVAIEILNPGQVPVLLVISHYIHLLSKFNGHGQIAFVKRNLLSCLVVVCTLTGVLIGPLHAPTFKFWSIIMDLELTMLIFVRAIREVDFQL